MAQAFEGSRPRPLRGGGGVARIPPHDLDAEESLLGAMLLSSDAISQAVEICGAGDFYKPAHGHIFQAIVSLFERGQPADLVTAADELRRTGMIEAVGDPSILLSLPANTPHIGNAVHYARIVEEHALLRRMVGVGADITDIGYAAPDDVIAAVDEAESMVFELSQRRTTESIAALRSLLGPSLERIEELGQRGGQVTGVATGYVQVDEILAGLQPQSLTIIGARPAMGKTSFAMGLLAHVGIALHRPALLFSLEMGHLELTQRLLASEARVDAQRLRTGHLHDRDWERLGVAVSRLDDSRIFIDDNPNLTVMDIRARARRLKRSEGDLGVVIVDYLQLMTGRNKAENRQVEVAEISRGLKILAREIECPVVALSQLSRNLEARQDKRPMLSDLRESGCMPADTALLRADTGEQVTIGELVLTQEQPLVWSMDRERRLVPRRLLRAFPSGVRPVCRLQLRSGLELEATDNHPFFSPCGWRALGDLRVGDTIAVPARVPEPEGVTPWDPDELILLARLLTQGKVVPVVRCTASDPADRDALAQAARRRFGIEARARPSGGAWEMEFPSPYGLTRGRRHPMRRWLESLGIGGAARPCALPESLFRAPDDQLALFLRQVWQVAGSIGEDGATCRVRGRELAEGLQRLLLRLALRSRVDVDRKTGEETWWNVEVAEIDDPPRLFAGGGEARAVDVGWDEIGAITLVGEKPTFDATVEGTHNFVANGVVAHNSLEQDADVVLFIFREEQYEPDLPNDRRGLAEIIVAKHRNGPTGFAHLVFLNQYARFDNMRM